MPPAVEGFAFLAEIGLARQDVHIKIFGIITRSPGNGNDNDADGKENWGHEDSIEEHAILFDNTFLSVVD